MSETVSKASIIAKIASGRWIFATCSAFAFTVLATGGVFVELVDPKDAFQVIGMIAAFYFGNRATQDLSNNGSSNSH